MKTVIDGNLRVWTVGNMHITLTVVSFNCETKLGKVSVPRLLYHGRDYWKNRIFRLDSSRSSLITRISLFSLLLLG